MVWDKLIYFHSLLPIMYLYSKTIISTPRLYISTLRFLANFDTTLFACTHCLVIFLIFKCVLVKSASWHLEKYSKTQLHLVDVFENKFIQTMLCQLVLLTFKNIKKFIIKVFNKVSYFSSLRDSKINLLYP